MMNSRTTKDIPSFCSYLPDALRLRFEDKLTIRYRVAITRLSLIRSA